MSIRTTSPDIYGRADIEFTDERSGSIPVFLGFFVIATERAASFALAAPEAGADDGKKLEIVSLTAFPHRFATSPKAFNGQFDVLTFSGEVGNSVILTALGGFWHVPSYSTTAGGGCTLEASTISTSPLLGLPSRTGDSGSIAVSTDDPALEWAATSSSEDWLMITAGASGTGPGVVEWTATANSGSTTRRGVIQVTPSTGIARMFFVSQEGGAPPPTFSVNPISVDTDGAGGSGSLAVTSSSQTVPWTAASSDPAVVELTTSSGTGDGTIPYTVNPNPTAVLKTATITVTPSGETSQESSIPVTMAGATLSITPPSATVVANGEGGNIAVLTNSPVLDWTVTSDQPWVTFTEVDGTGPGEIHWTAAENTTELVRSAVVTVTPAGVDARRTTARTGTPQGFPIDQAAGTPAATSDHTPSRDTGRGERIPNGPKHGGRHRAS